MRQKTTIDKQWKRASDDSRTTVSTGMRSACARNQVVMSSPNLSRRCLVVAENTVTPS